jgi:general secretion pathway protein G
MLSKTQRSGFSLVELMFAVLILAVLSLIAVPLYTGYKDKGNNAKAVADLTAIEGEIERYHSETFRYPADWAEIAPRLPNIGNDPWGNAYVYLNIEDGGHGIMGSVRKDHALNPINTDYDLYSLGKNGVTKEQITQKDSVDDIVRARNGGFTGLASDF